MKTIGYIFMTLVALALTAQAATIEWDNGDPSRSWMAAANWNPDAVPASGNDYTASLGAVVDVLNEDFTGGSLTLSAAIMRYSDVANSWGIDTLTNNAGIIRIQHAGRAVSGSITNLTLGVGTTRLMVDTIDSALTLDIGTLNFASGAAPYSTGAGSITLNVGSINASGGEVFRVGGGVFDLDGAADSQVIGLNIDNGIYVLDEARSFASLEIDGTVFNAGIYNYGDFTAGQQALLTNDGGSLTVIPEPAALGLVGLVSAMLIGVRRVFLMG